ncbi:MAG: ABC transporter ATP-binding protein [Alphaproteobacteria bacterium]|nr:ABC transporter ATP-binding protein [Alphaproteobacteria bacterium]
MTEPTPTDDPDYAPDYAVEISNLVKTYRGEEGQEPTQALKGINLRIPRGSIFGLLGPNGAGKSTLINVLASLVIKTSGTASIWGYEVSQSPRMARSSIGVVPQELTLDSFFSARELLDLQAGLYGVPQNERRTEELLDIVGLSEKADVSGRSLSGGMKRRLMIAKALAHSPPVLVLDEPTAGVDVELRRSLWNYVKKLNAAGTTILLTTHYLEEAQELCDRIAIINHGSLIANDTKENLLLRIDNKRLTLTLDRSFQELPENMRAQGWERLDPQRLTIAYRPSQMAASALLRLVQMNGFTIKDISTDETTIEDVFLQLTGTSEKEPPRDNGKPPQDDIEQL